MAILHLKAKPNSRTSQLFVAADGTVTARLAAPAHDGKANAAPQLLLAATFGCPSAASCGGPATPRRSKKADALARLVGPAAKP